MAFHHNVKQKAIAARWKQERESRVGGLFEKIPISLRETLVTASRLEPNLIFPPDVEDFDRPYIRFGCRSADTSVIAQYICLPCPSGIQFTDGAEYSSISMGKIAAYADITRAGLEGYEEGGFTGALSGAAGNAFDQATSAGSIGAGILATRAIGADSLTKGLEFGSKMTINPRMNTAFTGNTLRTFGFSFKLIGSSKEEVDTIKQIQQYFQEQVYAAEVGGEKVMLKYPNQWVVQFMDPNGGELTHVPKIYTTYLTSCSTQVNATGATFRRDMSPIEVDVSLAFQETKVLTRDELHRLNVNGDRRNEDTATFQQGFNELRSTVDNLLKTAENEVDKRLAPSPAGPVTPSPATNSPTPPRKGPVYGHSGGARP